MENPKQQLMIRICILAPPGPADSEGALLVTPRPSSMNGSGRVKVGMVEYLEELTTEFEILMLGISS